MVCTRTPFLRGLVARVLTLYTGGPEFNSQHRINQAQWHKPAIPEVKPDVQGHFQIHENLRPAWATKKCRLHLGDSMTCLRA